MDVSSYISPVYTTCSVTRPTVSLCVEKAFAHEGEGGGELTKGDGGCSPALDRRFGIFAGTGLWYSNIMDGEQSNIRRADGDAVL